MKRADGVLWRNRAESDVEHQRSNPVSYTHLRAHETDQDLVCRLLLKKKKTRQQKRNIVYDNVAEQKHTNASQTNKQQKA